MTPDKRVEEIVEDFDEIIHTYHSTRMGPNEREDFRTTLTQLVKEVEVGEQNRILQELKDETNNWKEGISHLTIEGIVTNWRDYEKVYHESTTSDVTKTKI